MTMQLDLPEVQAAIVEYLRARGITIDDAQQVQLAIIDHAGQRMNIVGCQPIVMAINVQLPERGTAR